jgi:2-epi-valiolone-7-phosphate 1-reductase
VLSVPAHRVAYRQVNQRGLVVKRANPEQVKDSAIVIAISSAGLCGTDLAMLSGARPSQAAVLGHEGAGVVLYAPAECGLSKGTRVVVNPVNRKQPHIVIGHSCDGIFREVFCIDATDALEGGHLVPCPNDCAPEDDLTLTEPIGSVLYSLALLREYCRAGSLLIRGSGTIAIFAAKLWSILTGSFALLVSQSEDHARWLRDSVRWPSTVRICGSRELPDAIRECPGGPGFGAAILCCSRECAPEGLRCLLDHVEENAAIDLMAGFPAEYKEDRLGAIDLDRIRWDNICGASTAPPTTVLDLSTGKKVRLLGHRGTAAQHLLQAIDLVSPKLISLDDIPHRLLNLQELPATVNEMLSPETRRHTKWVKAIVRFRDGNAEC